METCEICPRQCKVDRKIETGFCKVLQTPLVASAMVHMWEEPPISGKRGSGTVFFAGCNLGCVFCQNYDISQEATGVEMSPGELAETFMELEKRGVHNINLVTPSHFVPQLAEAIKLAKKDGINIPFVYNSSGYDAASSLQLMDGLIDIYLPDLKYSTDSLGRRYSGVPDYFTVAAKALKEMYRQVGAPVLQNGIMQKGLLIRHLVLPGLSKDSLAILDWIKANTPLAGISLLAQYRPAHKVGKAGKFEEINRRPAAQEIREVESRIKALGLDRNIVL